MGSIKALAAAAALATALTIGPAAEPVRAFYWSGNLMTNGGAQNAPSLAPWRFINNPTHSSIFCNGPSTRFRIRRYTAADVPDKPAGANAGTHLFSGQSFAGDVGRKCMGQLIDLQTYRQQINRGVTYKLSAWLGVGSDDDEDFVTGTVCFFDVNFDLVGRCPNAAIKVFGPTTPHEKMFYMEDQGSVPYLARYAAVLFNAYDAGTNQNGRNRGAFDNARFRLLLN